MMRGCIRIPRFLVPQAEAEAWPARPVGGQAGTVADFFLPEQLEEKERQQAIERIRTNMYAALQQDVTDKLARGLILTERITEAGYRKGIVAAFDLEAFSLGKESAPVRIASLWDAERAKELAALRGRVPMEFPSAVVLYRDKKGKAISEAGDMLEPLYNFTVPGGKIRGKFIPDYIAQGVAAEMYSRGEPCFIVADGLEEAAAAKAHWEALKQRLGREEQRNHPARFFAAEFLNACDGAVRLAPIHRIADGIDPSLIADSFTKNLCVKREGNVFTLASATPENVARADGILARLAALSGGGISYEEDEARAAAYAAAEKDRAAVLLPAPDAEELFAAKGDLPMPFFTVGGGNARRFCLEGREIGYD